MCATGRKDAVHVSVGVWCSAGGVCVWMECAGKREHTVIRVALSSCLDTLTWTLVSGRMES